MSAWQTFVRDVIGNDAQATVARRSSVDQATISRWLRDDEPAQPSCRAAVSFARGYGLNVLTVLVRAGIITESESRLRTPKLAQATTAELIAELGRRNEERVA